MIFRPDPASYRMGDYWLFEHDGLVFQYYLKREVDGPFGRIGQAVSRDLLHWDEIDDIVIEPHAGDWDGAQRISRTGYTIEHGGRFWMAYGASEAAAEKIGWLVSDDLATWERPSSTPVMWPQTQHYEHPDGAQTVEYGYYWRDPCFVRQGDHWEAFVCARSSHGPHGGRACIGRARSRDLEHWEYLPPVFAPGRYRSIEVPHYFELDGRHYFLFSTMSRKGIRLASPKGQLTSGVYYCMGEEYEGPYAVPADDLLVGENTYVGRHFAFQGEDLFAHLNQREWDEVGDRPTFGLPKRFGQRADGSLYLRFWSGASRLWAGSTPISLGVAPELMMSLPGDWQLDEERTLSGYSEYGPSAVWTGIEGSDFHLAFGMRVGHSARGSVLIRGDERGGAIFTINRAERQFEIGTAEGVRSGFHLKLADTIPFAATPEIDMAACESALSVRVLACAEIVEAYGDDVLVFSKSLATMNRSGRIGFTVDTGNIKVTDLAACAMSN